MYAFLDRAPGVLIDVLPGLRRGRPVRRASIRRMPRRSSSWAIGFEITGWPRRSCRAAPENEPVSMTRTKASIADRSRGPGARDSGPHLSGQGCSDPNALDPATRTLMTEIDLLNPDGELSPGTYCTVELEIPRRTPVTDRAGRSNRLRPRWPPRVRGRKRHRAQPQDH